VREFWAYTAARIGIFVVCYAVLVGVLLLVQGSPIPLLWPLVVAAVVSSVLSVVLLGGLRARFRDSVHSRAARMSRH
jgi:CHASE2 domain-containing sensor protein